MNIPILYEDNHVLVVEKPVNVPVQEDRTKDKDLHSTLKNDIKVRYNKPGNVYLALIHRLDRPVGGVMTFAKTSKAASRLSDEMRRKAIDKKYLAVVRGTIEEKQGILEDYLVKNRRKNKVYPVSGDHQEAKKAKLEYKVVGRKEGLSLLSQASHRKTAPNSCTTFLTRIPYLWRPKIRKRCKFAWSANCLVVS